MVYVRETLVLCFALFYYLVCISFVTFWIFFSVLCNGGIALGLVIVTGRDVRGSRPGMFEVAGRAKWDAWQAREGTSKEDAVRLYLTTVSAQFRKYGQADAIPQSAGDYGE